MVLGDRLGDIITAEPAAAVLIAAEPTAEPRKLFKFEPGTEPSGLLAGKLSSAEEVSCKDSWMVWMLASNADGTPANSAEPKRISQGEPPDASERPDGIPACSDRAQARAPLSRSDLRVLSKTNATRSAVPLAAAASIPEAPHRSCNIQSWEMMCSALPMASNSAVAAASERERSETSALPQTCSEEAAFVSRSMVLEGTDIWRRSMKMSATSTSSATSSMHIRSRL